MSQTKLFPEVTDRAKPPGTEPEWRQNFWQKFSRLEQRFGRGETYAPRARELILAGVVPEWVFRGALLAENSEHVDRCQKAVLALERLHAEIFGKGNPPHE